MLYNMIKGVCATDARIVGVMNWKNVRKKTLKNFFETDFADLLIKSMKLPLIKAKSANSKEFKNILLRLNPDLILVGTWGEKIKKDIFDLPKIAAINIHPSLLPKYRGANPYSRAIMFGDEKSGVTFHLITEKFDAGPILLQREAEILKTDNAKILKHRLCKLVRPMCVELINKLETGIMLPVEQDESKAAYYPHVKQDEIVIEPHQMTYDEIDCRIRGLAPWQSTYLLYREEFFKIFKYSKSLRYIKQSGRNLCLKTKDGIFIYFENLQAMGSKKYFTSIILKLLQKSD